MISKDQAITDIFNKFSVNIVLKLKISTDRGYDADFIVTYGQVKKAVNKFRNHRSIIVTKNKKKK